MASKAKKIVRYVDQTTGEIREIYQHIDLWFDETEGYLWGPGRVGVKTFANRALPPEFTWTERGRVHELKHYILQDNQFLVYRGNKSINPITLKEMCRILMMSERQCNELVKKMKYHKIIKEVKFNGLVYFAFNPVYGFKGKRISPTVYLFFQEELQNELPEWVIKRFAEMAPELKPVFQVIK